MTQIPFIDLPQQHKALEEELVEVFRDALRTASFIGGQQVQAFEEEFAAFCGTKYCVGVNSGTDALRFALIAAGIRPGDTVITVPNTFIATAEAISQAGAIPLFVDVDKQTYNLDPNKLEDYLKICNLQSAPSNRPKAIIPVHLYGQPADMDAILEIAERHNLIVIEDACQAHGAQYFSEKENRWRTVGSIGLASASSFYPGKNLGACGEGGAVTTDSSELAEKIRMLRDHGQSRKYCHEMEGFNGRLDAVQAGCLRIKLKLLAKWNESRRQNAYRYENYFNNSNCITLPFESERTKSVYHLYVIRTEKRDELQKYLTENGIATGIHYPIPIHLQNAYSHLGYRKGAFPVSEKLATEILSLPMYPELQADQQEYIVNKIKNFVSA
jgi:dTDP-4-amino-4,6-dideoxygalactose transaminase